ncbi:transmembrane protein, putative [Medicago truncatula]|uniref:Transmembrane protein, putative n=1 Tax=Medicago truncatula TaxID=3880 RepID=G7KFJ7_MEDTR|nr:transmembrane protein, putative [Medicago truncatula]
MYQLDHEIAFFDVKATWTLTSVSSMIWPSKVKLTQELQQKKLHFLGIRRKKKKLPQVTSSVLLIVLWILMGRSFCFAIGSWLLAALLFGWLRCFSGGPGVRGALLMWF